MFRETSSISGSAGADAVSGVLVERATSAVGGDGAQGLTATAASTASAGGFVINIVYDSSVDSAPTGFKTAINYVVDYYESVFNDPITITIDVGWGEIGGGALPSGALGASETYLSVFSYAQVKAALAADAKSADDTTAVASLPASNPTGSGTFIIATAEAKALGLITNSSNIDAYIGFGSGHNYTFDPNNRAVSGTFDFIGVAEHEISEAMGRIASLGSSVGSLSNTYTALDLFRYSSPGTRELTAGHTAYFSLNGGITDLNNFNTLSYGDSGDWAANTGNDAYNAFGYSGVANLVTAADLQVMDAIGWDRMTTAKVDTPPVVTPTSTNIVATNGQSFAAAALFTASDADGDAITQYDFWDTGGGGGQFLVNGVSQPTNQDVYVTDAQLDQTTYQSGSGTDTLWVRAYDGTQWGDWSSSFTVTASGETSAGSTSSNPGAREARDIAVSDGNWKPVRSDDESDWRLMVNPSDSLLGG